MLGEVFLAGAGLITGTLTSVTIHQRSGDTTLPYFRMPDCGLAGVEAIHYRIDSVVNEAVAEAGLTPAELQRAGIFIGSTSFDMAGCEEALKAISRETGAPCSEEDINRHVPSFTCLTAYLQQRFGLNGPLFTFNTACTSSANALLYAAAMIRRGEIQHALVLGLEFYNEVTALGFSALQLVSSGGMRPFSAERDGLWLGEACGAVVLGKKKTPGSFRLLGGASMGDRFSMTASNPEGTFVEKVIRQALRNASVSASEIAMAKAHGTASLSNDEAESAGMVRLFGTSCPPVVAIKPLIGHTLGACGIVELVLFCRGLQQGELVSANTPFDSRFGLRPATPRDIPPQGNYLLNYFGFGGNSTALVIAHD